MTEFEQTSLKEVESLLESRRADVLAFIRFLKLTIPGDEIEVEKRYDKALKTIHARAKKYKITEEDINAEIRAVREEHARRT